MYLFFPPAKGGKGREWVQNKGNKKEIKHENKLNMQKKN